MLLLRVSQSVCPAAGRISLPAIDQGFVAGKHVTGIIPDEFLKLPTAR